MNRLGWLLHRVGRDAEALAKFQAAGVVDPADQALAYLHELLQGQILLSLDRVAEALAAFRRARGILPGAQSARAALMNALLLSGDRDQAAALAVDLQASPATMLDPWWMYWQGDYRRYPDALRRVREMIR
jgi:tetratricopeptide (TPR) repeat protein